LDCATAAASGSTTVGSAASSLPEGRASPQATMAATTESAAIRRDTGAAPAER
jgi:hypothetical protein